MPMRADVGWVQSQWSYVCGAAMCPESRSCSVEAASRLSLSMNPICAVMKWGGRYIPAFERRKKNGRGNSRDVRRVYYVGGG